MGSAELEEPTVRELYCLLLVDSVIDVFFLVQTQ